MMLRPLRPLASSLLRVVAATGVSVALAVWALPEIAWPKLGGRATVEERPIASLFPPELLAYLEVEDAGELATLYPDSRLARLLNEDPRLADYRQSPDYNQLKAGLSFVQVMSGLSPEQLVRNFLGERLAAGVIPQAEGEPGVLLVVQAQDEEHAEVLGRVVQGLAQSDADNQVETGEHRGLEGFSINQELYLTVVGARLMAASQGELLKAAVDRALDGGKGFAATEAHRAVRAELEAGARAAFDVDLAAIRTLAGGRFGEERLAEALPSLLFQDVIDRANLCPRLRGRLHADRDELRLELDLPTAGVELPERLAFCAQDAAQQGGLLELSGPQTFTTLSGWRDVSRFWDDRDLLVGEDAEKGFAEFESGLGIFFSGKSLPDELLPKIRSDWVLVGARQSFERGPAPPKVRFPAGALILHVDDPEAMFEELSVALQSLLAVLNIQRGEQGQTPMRLFVEQRDGRTVYGGRFLQNDGRPYDVARFNFSPAITRVGDRVVASTSEELLDEVVAALTAPGGTRSSPPGTLMRWQLDVAPGLALLRENRDALVAQTVVDDAKTFEQAGQEFDLLALGIEQLSELSLCTRLVDESFRLELRLGWSEGAPLAKAVAAAGTTEGE